MYFKIDFNIKFYGAIIIFVMVPKFMENVLTLIFYLLSLTF